MAVPAAGSVSAPAPVSTPGPVSVPATVPVAAPASAKPRGRRNTAALRGDSVSASVSVRDRLLVMGLGEPHSLGKGDHSWDSSFSRRHFGLREVLPVVRKRDKSLFEQIHRAMNSVVLNIAEADGNDAGTAKARFASACGSAKEVRAGLQLAVAYGYVPSARVQAVDIALDEVCAMSWRLSGR